MLLAIYGVGLLGSGVFAADPGRGFPPGTTDPLRISTTGLLHFVFGGIAFYALVGACLVFALRFKQLQQSKWAVFSFATGVCFLASFVAISVGPPPSSVLLAFYIAVAWAWVWHAVLHMKLNREISAA